MPGIKSFEVMFRWRSNWRTYPILGDSSTSCENAVTSRPVRRNRADGNGMFTQILWFCLFAELLLIQVSPVQCSAHIQELLHTFLEKKSPSDYRNLEDLTIVHPIQVDSSGTFITHHIAPSRRKRGLAESPTPGPVHYRLKANDQNFHLELRPNELLLSPGFTVQRRWRDRSIREEYVPELESCHYHGNMPSHPSSTAAISLCDGGMVGLLRTASDDYIIEPLPSHLEKLFNQTTTPSPTSMPKSRPHIMYKRSVTSHEPWRQPHRQPHQGNDTRTKEQKIHQHFCGRRKKYQPHPPVDPVFFIDEYPSSPHNRTRRSLVGDVYQSRFVETLVVVDPPMVRNHTREKVTTYVLSVMNIVANLYRDTSLGNTVNMVVVNLIILEEDQPGLVIEHHADRSLNSFCQWQSTLSLPNGTRHDHAILLTGKDICSWKNEPCDTLGYAPIGGMCSKYRSCTINEDTGIGLAFTIAHESGHSFGMVHDGDGNGCRKQGGNIMSSTLSGHTGRFTWSSCSSTNMDTFLQSPRASCTANEPLPSQEYVFPSRLPGELYNADQQCQWQFGAKARLCSINFGKSLCKFIWCHRGERRCETKFLPAADGTPCGSGLWCIQGECLLRGEKGPPPIDGGWGEYGDYLECSTTCGQGVQYKVRECDNPPPQNGGKYCQGPGKIYQMCNIQACTGTELSDFRAEQCAMYDSRSFRGYYYEWKPYVQVPRSEQCKLYCMADGFSFYFALAGKVVDGTSCNGDSRDVCVNGKCEIVGCDNVLGSTAEYDACGICEGDNSTCQFVSGTYMKQFSQNDYYDVVDIPAGARHIRIAEDAPSDSYLALRNTHYQYYITASWMVDWPGNFHVAGTVFTYKRPYGTPESLAAPGPTTEDLVVEILLRGSNPGIHYEYVIPAPPVTTPVPAPVYAWNTTVSQCSASCGGGVKTVVVTCIEDNFTIVDDSFCSDTPRPSGRVRPCGRTSCPATWMTTPWKTCNQQCGGGIQKRSVFCIRKMADGHNKTIKNRHCRMEKPPRWLSCNIHDCPAQWHSGGWSECSHTCGDGFKQRAVACISRNPNGPNIEKEQGECGHLVKPKMRVPCDLGRCPLNIQWFISAWSSCSRTCGPGKQSRIIKCSHLDDQGQYREIPEGDCAHLDRPDLTVSRPCHLTECVVVKERGQWTTGQWTQCSVSCGGGTQSRAVLCVGTGSGNPVECEPSGKPSKTQICSTETCNARGVGGCVDEYPWCNLVPNYNMCDHQFYGKKCCYSCRYQNA